MDDMVDTTFFFLSPGHGRDLLFPLVRIPFGIWGAFAEKTQEGKNLALVQCSWDMSDLWRLSIPPLLSLDLKVAVYTAAYSTNSNLCLLY